MIVSMNGVRGTQLQHVVVVSRVVGGRQTCCRVSNSSWTTRVERL